MVLKVAICDDMPIIARAIEELLLDYNSSLFEIDIFYSPSRLIEIIKDNTYDLFILDIEFPNQSGIEIAESIRTVNFTCPIIFITSFKEYMEQAFKVNTFDYILKPITRENLFSALNRVVTYLDFDDSRFVFTFNKVFYTLSFSNIIYFEKNKRNVIIHTPSQTYETVLHTKDLLFKLSDKFVQVHTSFIVNVRHIKKCTSHSIIINLNDKETVEIPISRKFLQTARKQIFLKLRELI